MLSYLKRLFGLNKPYRRAATRIRRRTAITLVRHDFVCLDHNYGYAASPVRVRRVWEEALKPFWTRYGPGETGGDYRVLRFRDGKRAALSGRHVYANSDGVSIGCKFIDRYDVEQFAAQMGWLEED